MADFDKLGYLGNGPEQGLFGDMNFSGLQGYNGIGGGSNQIGYMGGGNSTDMLGYLGQGMGAFKGLADIYGMFKSLGLQSDAFKFAQKGTKKNFNASATGFNNQVDKYNAARHASATYNGRDLDSLSRYAPKKVDRWK